MPICNRKFRAISAGWRTALKVGGFAGEFMIVQSNGGVMDVDTAARLPVRTALSGPAAGVIAAGYIAQAAGFPGCDHRRHGRHLV